MRASLLRYLEGGFNVFCCASVEGRTIAVVYKDRQRWSPPTEVRHAQQTLGLDTTRGISPQENHLRVYLALRALLGAAEQARLTLDLQDSDESGGCPLEVYRRVLHEWIESVLYTHLTLPKILRVYILVVCVACSITYIDI